MGDESDDDGADEVEVEDLRKKKREVVGLGGMRGHAHPVNVGYCEPGAQYFCRVFVWVGTWIYLVT